MGEKCWYSHEEPDSRSKNGTSTCNGELELSSCETSIAKERNAQEDEMCPGLGCNHWRLICAVVPRDVVLEHHVQTLIRLHRSRYRKTQFDLRSRVSNAKKPRSMKGSDVAVQLAEAQLREAAIESVLRGCYGGPPARDRSTGCTSYTPY